MSDKEVLQILKETGAIIQNTHVELASGRHSDTYVLKDALYSYPRKVDAICRSLAQRYCCNNIEVVAAPAIGGVVLSQGAAYHLCGISLRDVRAVYAEKTEHGFSFRRGYQDILRGRTVLVVEDILTTGRSVAGVVAAARAAGAHVRAVVALVNRGNVTTQTLDVPEVCSLVDMPLQSWAPEECPLCAVGTPLERRSA